MVWRGEEDRGCWGTVYVENDVKLQVPEAAVGGEPRKQLMYWEKNSLKIYSWDIKFISVK